MQGSTVRGSPTERNKKTLTHTYDRNIDADSSTHDEQAATAAAAAAAADDVSAGRSRQLVSVVDDVDDVPRSASSMM